MTHLPVLVDTFLHNRTQSLIVSAILFAPIAVLVAIAAWRARRTGDVQAAAAAFFTANLLPVYHRYYDALVLVLVLAWAVRAWRRSPVLVLAGLALLAVFIAPLDWARDVVSLQTVPKHWGQYWWWQCIILPHPVWATLAFTAVLLADNFKIPAARPDPALAIGPSPGS